MKPFKVIAAMSLNRVIGNGPDIPWHIPEDFKWFKQTTMGQVLVMGRKTYESIGRPLPGRETVVLSRSGFADERVKTIASIDELEVDAREVFICGGGQIYAQLLSRCDVLYLTLVKREVEGDAFFPAFEDEFDLDETVRVEDEFEIRRYSRK
ncbi:MAG: dihydrofolate reductase [Limisphaerales bacterium]